MPISGCHDLPLATFNLPSRVFRHGCRRAECLERRWGGFFHTLSRGGCGWLAGPPANTCSRNNPQNKQQQRPPQTKNPSCRHSVAACVSDHSRGQALAPATSPQNKRQQRPPTKTKSALILVASLQRRDGAEWALLRPPRAADSTPPNPPNPSCCRSTGGCGCLAGPPANTCSHNKPSKQTTTTPPLKTKNPSCRHSVAACVSDHSRGQALAPATTLKTNGNNAPPQNQKPLVPSLCGGMRV